MLLGFLDWTWNSTPWIIWPLVGVIAFALIYLLLSKTGNKQPGGPSPAAAIVQAFTPAPAPVPANLSPRLAPMANPGDVQTHLEELALLANLEGQTDIAIILTNLAAGDEEETHRAIRELATRFRSPRAITAAAKQVVLRHLEELLDDVDVKRIIDRRKA